jgi:iron complex outermembrane receptor protein
MRSRIAVVMAGASLVAMASSAVAQPAPSPGAAAAGGEEATLGEIVVTARRRSESLQEVPQVVNAVTADTLQKLNIQQFQDIQTVVPGLSLQQGATGYNAEASLRGVTFTVNTSAQPTVAMYLNDAPVQSNFLFQAMFDVGQIEVLRGPQGTTRGISAPSGAITLTTHKPSLSDFGGYVDVTATDLQGRNVQGAINVPVVKDVMALRVAGLLNQSQYDGVRSIHSNIAPREVTGAVRTSVSFEPNDRFNANVVYQHLDRNLTSFQQVIGAGDGNAINPPLAVTDRAAVQDLPRIVHQHTDAVTAQIDSRIFGQHLSYVGSYQRFKLTVQAALDTGNVLPGIEVFQHNFNTRTETTQEIRLASDPAPGRFFDYTVGAFYDWQDNGGTVLNPGTFLPGAFGPPGTFSLAAFNPVYQVPVVVSIPNTYQETSLFGSLTLHLGPHTELSGGIRHIISIQSGSANLATADGRIALALPGVPCAAVGLLPSPYPGACDFTVRGSTIQNLSSRTSERPNIYNVSLSHHITRDLLVYANTGASFRPRPTAIGVNNATNNPVLNSFIFLQPETSRAYEVGLKSTFLDGRARVNLALWRQRFHNLIVYVPGVPYLSNSGQGFQVSNFNFTANAAEALVSGVDLESAFQITRDWNVSFQYSYAHGNIEGNSRIPCNDSNFDGVPDNGKVTSVSQFPPGTLIALCPGGTVSRNPVWNASLQTEYTHPVTEAANGFLRALWTYYPENKYAEPGFVVPSYSLVNFYAGLRSHDGAWEVSLFARNVFENQTLLDRATQTQTFSPIGNFFASHNVSNYVTVNGYTPRREVGVNVHYAWGSR